MSSTQGKQQLKNNIQSNNHEVYILSVDEMDKVVKSSSNKLNEESNSIWQSLKGKMEYGAGYYANLDDAKVLTKLVGDLGSFGSQAYVKNYNGKVHIILKGRPGLRKVLTGTKYGIANPKVVTMGLGKVGAVNAAKYGGIISIVLITAFRVIDFFMTDTMTLNQLVGTLATDIVKIGIATGASIAAASAVVGFGVTLAIGPILAVVVVGVAFNYGLNELDKKYNITDRVVAGLDEMESDTRALGNRLKQKATRSANQLTESVIDYAVDSMKRIVINTAKNTLKNFLSSKPRVF
jgi:hypothetical protein